MQIQIQVIKREGDVPDSGRQAIHVETHERRGDIFTIQKLDTILEGDDVVTFTIPSGGRLVINTPLTHEEVVYDRDQAAAVRPSQQMGLEGADRPQPPAPRVPVPDVEQPPEATTEEPPPEVPEPEAPATTSGRRYKPDEKK